MDLSIYNPQLSDVSVSDTRRGNTTGFVVILNRPQQVWSLVYKCCEGIMPWERSKRLNTWTARPPQARASDDIFQWKPGIVTNSPLDLLSEKLMLYFAFAVTISHTKPLIPLFLPGTVPCPKTHKGLLVSLLLPTTIYWPYSTHRATGTIATPCHWILTLEQITEPLVLSPLPVTESWL